MSQHMRDLHSGIRTQGAVRAYNQRTNLGPAGLSSGVSRNARRRMNRLGRAVNVMQGIPQVNTDGTLRQPGQQFEEEAFGSSAAEVSPIYGRPYQDRAMMGIKQAVASVVGSTPTGKAWALAALHPCGSGEVISPTVGEVVGMCDTMTGSVATPVYRGETHVPFVKTLFPNPALPNLGSTTYGVDLIIPPIPEIDFIYRLRDDATNVNTPWVVIRQQGYELPVYTDLGGDVLGYNDSSIGTTFATSGYGKARIIAMGHTIELDAGALNDQGRVVVGQMEGQWKRLALAPNQSVVTTGEFVTGVGPPVTTNSAVTAVRNYGPEDAADVWLLNVPTDPMVVTANCPGAYQGLAKHGAYVVSKFTSPLLGYSFKRTAGESVFDTGATDIQEGGQIRPYLPQTAFAINSTGRETGENLTDSEGFYSGNDRLRSGFSNGALPIRSGLEEVAVIQGDTLAPFCGEPSDMMTAVVMFRNLPVGSGTSGLTASLRIKSRTYFEAISNASNPAVAPYIHPPAQFDFPALNSVIVSGKQLADAYPACANSLGTILSKIWSALRGTSAIVGGLGIPIVSDVGRLANTTMEGVDNIAGMFR